MPTLTAIEMFIRVAEEGSFTKAAEALSASRTMASKYVSDLEAELGVRLFERTTRKVHLTEAGVAYLDKARHALDTLEVASDEASHFGGNATGVLRISAPLNFGSSQLAPAIARFRELCPDVSIELLLNDRKVDLIEEGYDAALRIGELKDSSLISRKLATVRRVLCASPQYLERHGKPQKPSDIEDHECLGYHYSSEGQFWNLTDLSTQKTKRTRISGAVHTNNGDVNLQLAIQSVGIANLPTFIANDALNSGKLVQVLPGFEPPAIYLYVVFGPGRLQPLKLRRFVDHLVDEFKGEPAWDRP